LNLCPSNNSALTLKMNVIQPILRRIPLVHPQQLRVPNYYSTKPHITPFPAHDLDIGKQHLGRYSVLQLVSCLQYRMLQRNATSNTITTNNSLTESQMNNISLARRLVKHIYDQTSNDNPETTKESQDRLNLFQECHSGGSLHSL